MELYILVNILSFFLLLPMLGFTGAGSGTSGDPYIVTTVSELDEVRNELTAVYEQANDLDVGAETDNSGGSFWNGGSGWLPIGTFTGEYRGAGFKQDGMFISRTGTTNVGLFSIIEGAIIRELGLENVDVSGGTHVAGMVGLQNNTTTGSTIERCFVTGSVQSFAGSEARTGGFFGLQNEGDTVCNDCYSTASVTENNNENAVGGFVGFLRGTLNRCYSTGLVTSTGNNVGGLVGRDLASTVNDSFWDTQTSGQSTSNGGTGKTTAEMQDVATFTSTATAGLTNPWDFVGNPNDDTANNDWWDIDTGYPFLTAFTAGGGTTLTLSGASENIFAGNSNLSVNSTMAGQQLTQLGGNASMSLKSLISGQQSTVSGGNASLLEKATVSGLAVTRTQGSALIKLMASLLGTDESALGGSANAKSDQNMSGSQVTLIGGSSNANLLKTLSGSDETVTSGNALLELLGNVIRLSGTTQSEFGGNGSLGKKMLLSGLSQTDSDGSASFVIKVKLSGSDISSIEGGADATVIISVSGDQVTLVGGSAALKLAASLAGQQLTTSGGSAILTPVGAPWIGTIDITNQPFYTITLKAEPIYDVDIEEKPLHNINIEVE